MKKDNTDCKSSIVSKNEITFTNSYEPRNPNVVIIGTPGHGKPILKGLKD